VQIAETYREPLGLTFVGRGFEVRVGTPWDEPLIQALTEAAQACAEACPTRALVWRG
jgi:NADH dehydrogenase/NADH:ubiquinone oxidoreductase subunit G